MYANRETNSSIYDVNMPVLPVVIIISTDAEAIFSVNDFGIVILLFKPDQHLTHAPGNTVQPRRIT